VQKSLLKPLQMGLKKKGQVQELLVKKHSWQLGLQQKQQLQKLLLLAPLQMEL
jgi:hypothetical protein